jgi:hypothetical protein
VNTDVSERVPSPNYNNTLFTNSIIIFKVENNTKGRGRFHFHYVTFLLTSQTTHYIVSTLHVIKLHYTAVSLSLLKAETTQQK